MRTPVAKVVRGRWRWSVIGCGPMKPFAVRGVAVLARCTASGLAGEAAVLIVSIFRRLCQSGSEVPPEATKKRHRQLGNPTDLGL